MPAPRDVAESLSRRIQDLAGQVDLQHMRDCPEFCGIPEDQVARIITAMEYAAAEIVRRVSNELLLQNFKLELQLRASR